MSLFKADQSLTNNSYYAATAPREQRFAPLRGNADCDVAIVGGGLAGLSAAIELADQGLSVVLLEARSIGYGASGRNGGQALAGLACEQDQIERQLGLEASRTVWNMTLEAIDLIHARCRRFGIDCDWRPGYLSLAVNARKGRELAQWHERMQRDYGFEATPIRPAEVSQWIASPRFHSGLHDPRSGHLHPLKYTLGLGRAAASLGVRIHEDTPVTALRAGATSELDTAGGTVRARHVLLAGNVYLQSIAPLLEHRLMPVGTYVVASEALEPALAQSLVPSQSAVCDTNFVLDYFRTTPDHRVLYGGRVSYSTITPAQPRREHALAHGAHLPATARHEDRVRLGRLRRHHDEPRAGLRPPRRHRRRRGDYANVYYLQGFSGHGLALTGLAGKLVAEAIGGNAARLDLFSRIRHRNFPGGRLLRTPALVVGMAYYRLRDLL